MGEDNTPKWVEAILSLPLLVFYVWLGINILNISELLIDYLILLIAKG